ncbi:MAG: hypothetical protein SWY16_20375 [Cyanobacteriota bacterium]|nr:hypothetical protein [Cyanobacteriota bacterium]
MSIPSKGCRKIVVDGIQYYWRVRHKPSYMQGIEHTQMSAAIELADRSGSVLVVEFPWFRPDSWITGKVKTVTPKIIAACIKKAIEQGWNPSVNSATFNYRYSENEFDSR